MKNMVATLPIFLSFGNDGGGVSPTPIILKIFHRHAQFTGDFTLHAGLALAKRATTPRILLAATISIALVIFRVLPMELIWVRISFAPGIY